MPNFTPRNYIEAPLRSSAIPNKATSHALFTTSSYNLGTHSLSVRLEVIDLASRLTTTIWKDEKINSADWIDEHDNIAWLAVQKSGNTSVFVGSRKQEKDPYIAGIIPGPVSDLKVQSFGPDRVGVVFTGLANFDGTVHNPADVPAKPSSAKYYTSHVARYWDSWTTSTRRAIFYACLELNSGGRYHLTTVYNAYASNAQKVERPLQVFGGSGDFAVSSRGIVYIAMDPKISPAFHTTTNAYHVNVRDFKQPPGETSRLVVEGFEGSTSSPTISPDGRKLALLKIKKNGADAQQTCVMLWNDFASEPTCSQLLRNSMWDLSAEAIVFQDDNTLLLLATESSAVALFTAETNPAADNQPRKIFGQDMIGAVYPCGPEHVLASSSSLIDNGTIRLINVFSSSPQIETLSSLSDSGKEFGLSEDQVEDLVVKGAGDYKVHSLVMRPTEFSPSKSYPVCFLIHGGPQMALWNAWNNYNTNPQIFASQGYYVVCPQFTGSKGYGQQFVDDVSGDWAGRPYKDIVAVFEYIKENVKGADTSRAILGGLSYGGYMTNWIQGQPLGREFKALFTINGIFSTHDFLARDNIFFIREDSKGFPWESDEIRFLFDRADPARFAGEWKTPHLIVHTEKDFRCPIEAALSAFNLLQLKEIESGLLIFEDEHHLVVKPENVARLFDAIFGFCNEKAGLSFSGDRIVAAR
ncbi:MAG: hypothetical protein M1821_001843 [Bathelium mastoideum]|nr:MAG: hypothetical protein M1821_001843 [Bathelium mastoideum]